MLIDKILHLGECDVVEDKGLILVRSRAIVVTGGPLARLLVGVNMSEVATTSEAKAPKGGFAASLRVMGSSRVDPMYPHLQPKPWAFVRKPVALGTETVIEVENIAPIMWIEMDFVDMQGLPSVTFFCNDTCVIR